MVKYKARLIRLTLRYRVDNIFNIKQLISKSNVIYGTNINNGNRTNHANVLMEDKQDQLTGNV